MALGQAVIDAAGPPEANLGARSAVADVSDTGISRGPGAGLADIGPALETPVGSTGDIGSDTPPPSLNSDFGAGQKSIGDGMSFMQQLKAGLGQSKATADKDMTVGTSLALGAASTALQTVASIGEIKDQSRAELEAMRDEFDRAFTDMEFTANLRDTRREMVEVDRVIQMANNIKQQNQGVASQTLQNQTQQFTRSPSSGGLL